MLSEVGVHGDDISSMKTMLLQEDGVTRGELRELVPFINTLKTIVANQMSLEESQRIEDPYKASLFQSLRRELKEPHGTERQSSHQLSTAISDRSKLCL
jgi:hypothetical protein